MTEDEKVELSTRTILIKTFNERLMWINRQKEDGEVFTVAQVSALLTDDLLSERDVRVLLRGQEEPCQTPEAESSRLTSQSV